MVLVFDAPDGTYRVYDTEKGHFGCYTAEGKICTVINVGHYRLDEQRLRDFLKKQGTPVPSIPKSPPPEKSMSNFIGDHYCPICGHKSRSRPPYTGEIGSYDVCPCCNFEYGFDDYIVGESFESWRRKWIEAGAGWPQSDVEGRPPGWSAAKQLLNIGIDLQQYKPNG